MRVVSWDGLASAGLHAPCAVTIGVFDGIHPGHRTLIDRVRTHEDHASVVLTFATHPAIALAPEEFRGYLQSRRQTLEELNTIGIDLCVLIDFSQEFRQMPGERFLNELRSRTGMRELVIGYDFRCGRGPDMDAAAIEAFLRSREVSVEIVAPILVDGSPVSSTRLRSLVTECRFAEFERCMAAPFSLDAADETVIADGAGCSAIAVSDGQTLAGRQILPPPGAYAAEVVCADAEVASSGRSRARTTLEIDEKCLRWPLAPKESIRYIVVHERLSKGERNALNEGAQGGARC